MPDPDMVNVSNMNDKDFEEALEIHEEIVELVAKNTRGKDMEWEELINFKNNKELEESEVWAEIKEFMTRRKQWTTGWATNQNYTCKFQVKMGFKSCLRQIKVCFVSSCQKIAVFSNMEEHCHQEDLDHVTAINYHWTGPQLDIIRNFIQLNGKNNNKVILDQLIVKGLCNGTGKYPTCAQVGTKKRNMKKTMKKFDNTVDVIRQCATENDDLEDENDALVVFNFPEGEEKYIKTEKDVTKVHVIEVPMMDRIDYENFEDINSEYVQDIAKEDYENVINTAQKKCNFDKLCCLLLQLEF